MTSEESEGATQRDQDTADRAVCAECQDVFSAGAGSHFRAGEFGVCRSCWGNLEEAQRERWAKRASKLRDQRVNGWR